MTTNKKLLHVVVRYKQLSSLENLRLSDDQCLQYYFLLCVCSSSVVVVVVHHRFFGRKVSPAVGLCLVGTHFRLPASKLTNKLAKLFFYTKH